MGKHRPLQNDLTTLSADMSLQIRDSARRSHYRPDILRRRCLCVTSRGPRLSRSNCLSEADAIASDALFYALATTQDLDAMPWMRPKS